MPNEGEGKFKSIKAHGIGDWLNAGQQSGTPFLSESKAQELIARNERKGDRFKKYKLPQFETYGPVDSFDEIANRIPEEKRTEKERFLVRCTPKDKSSSLKIERTKNIAWQDVATFIEQLSGGAANYTVEVREHWEPDYGGGLVADGEGHVSVEICRGSHADIEGKALGDIKGGVLDAEGFDTRSFRYHGDPSTEEKEMMMGALRFFTPHLTGEKLGELQMHAEFVYKEGKGYRFIDVEDDPFWTKKKKPEPLDQRDIQNLSFEALQHIGIAFGIPKSELVAVIQEGNINRNYQIKDVRSGIFYFLRQHRIEKKMEDLERLHAAERFFAQHGIPVVPAIPILEKPNVHVYAQDGQLYSVYPWLTGKRYEERLELPTTALESIARMQADVHLLSNDGAPEGLSERRGMGWDREKFFIDCARYEAMIEGKDHREPFDDLVLAVLRLQKQAVKKNTTRFEDMRLGTDHLIHGDVHPGNIFFNDDDTIKHIVDSEHVQYSARVLEVAKSLDYICLSPDFTEEDFERARTFLVAYHARYPLTREELVDGVRAYFLRTVHSTWKLREHYDKGNTRVDKMFLKDQKRFVYFAEHLDAFIERITHFIF
ncbi:MAG: phosphotransferase [bacterium]|nr:phosphotransferase [bacterium]